MEIAVVDGQRGLGNGRCLPAGPLRESAERLDEVHFVVTNGEVSDELPCDSVLMKIEATSFVNLGTGEKVSVDQSLFEYVHAVAGIGNPQRFFEELRGLGIESVEHPFADHHKFESNDFRFEQSLPVVMTEKDAVKCGHLDIDLSLVWYLEVTARLPESFFDSVVDKIGIHPSLAVTSNDG